MNVYRVLGAFVCAGTLLLTSQLPAQAVVSNDSPSLTYTADALLSRPVTIDVKKVALKQAIDAIAENAKVRIQYQGNTLDAVKSPVTIHAAARPLGAVLDEVLLGTSLRAIVSARDAITIKGDFIVNAQAQGTIVGKVTHAKTKQPVKGVTVSLGDDQTGVVTDETGSFRLTASVGNHTIHVRAIGFARQAVSVSVTEGGAVTANIVMEPSASVLDEIVVTGTVVATERKAITTPITVITADEIEKRGITRIEEFFRGQVPGVFAAELGSNAYRSDSLGGMQNTTVYSRGSSGLSFGNALPSPIKTFVDGVEMVNPSHLGAIDIQSIERIEIITGPQAATLYGSGAMGGVMQIFTKKGSQGGSTDYTLNLRYGVIESNLNTGKTPTHNHTFSMMGGIGPALSYAGNLSYRSQGQWQPALFSRSWGSSLGVTHVRGNLTVSASTSLTGGRNGTSGSSGNVLGRVMVERGEWTTGSLSGHVSNKISTSQSQVNTFNIDFKPTTSWQHHLTVGRSQNRLRMNPQSPAFSLLSDTLFSHNASAGERTTGNYNTTFITPNRFVVGATLTVGVNTSFGESRATKGCAAASTAASWIQCIPGNEYSMSVLDVRDRSSGGFGSLRLSVFNQLYLTLGLRGERNPNYGEDHKIDWTPTNGMTYTFEYRELSVKVLGAYGKATRAPSSDQRLESKIQVSPGEWEPHEWIGRKANPDLRPEYSRGPEGGIEIYYGNVGSLTINHYRQMVTDLIQSALVDSLPRVSNLSGDTSYTAVQQFINIAQVRQRGWEATGSTVVGPFSLRGTYSWNDSRVVGYATKSYASYDIGESFFRLPTHTAYWSANYAIGSTSFTWTSSFVGAQRRADSDSWYYREKSSSRMKMYIGVARPGTGIGQGTMPGYVKSDLVMLHKITPWASATVNVKNIGNSYSGENEVIKSVIGRQTTFGMSLRFPQR